MKNTTSTLGRSTLSARHLTAALFTTLLFAAAATGCKTLGLPENRLQSCESNDDCKAKDPKAAICANLRCVECAYDGDCPNNGFCTENHCKGPFHSAEDDNPDGPPTNLDACLSRCKDDQACVTKCQDQFKPAEPPKK